MRAVVHVDQVGLDVQRAVALGHPAGKHGADAEVAPGFLRVHLRTPVAECQTAGRDPELGKLRECVNQVLRNAIAEVLFVWIRAHVGEGQDRQGVDRLAGPVHPVKGHS